MEADKTSIRRHFDRGAATYDAASSLQAEMGRELLAAARAQLGDRPVRRIVELGCGTGVLTELLHATWPEAELLAIDLSPRMLARARERLATSPVELLEADAEAWLAATPAEPIDLLIANATVQWFSDPMSRLAAAATGLPTGGVMAISTFGPDTFRELRTAFARAAHEAGRPATERTLALPDLAAWRARLGRLPELELAASERRDQLGYPDLRAFLHHLRELGATLPAGQTAGLTRTALAAAERHYPARQGDGSVAATWHCLQFVATRR